LTFSVTFPAEGCPFEGLPHFPRAAHLLGLALKVAPRHVEAHRVAPDEVERPVDRHVLPALAQRHDHLDLVVHVGGLVGVGERAREIEVVGVLLEEERRLAVGVVAHLDRVGRVVAADAVDAPHRKDVVRPGDGGGDGGGWGDHGLHSGELLSLVAGGMADGRGRFNRRLNPAG
jgi:hypothetical protein